MISKEYVQLITVKIDHARCDKTQYNSGASVVLCWAWHVFHVYNLTLFCCLGWVSGHLNLAVWTGTTLEHFHTGIFPTYLQRCSLPFAVMIEHYMLGFFFFFFSLSWSKLGKLILPLSSIYPLCDSQLHFCNSIVFFIPLTSLWISKHSGDQ